MRTHLHVDEVQSVTARASAREGQRLDYELPPLKLRPPWLIFLAKHFAPKNHERYLMQGITLTQEELAAIRAMPKKRPWWLAFLRRQFHRFFPEADD
jgi:hypothetical protein